MMEFPKKKSIAPDLDAVVTQPSATAAGAADTDISNVEGAFVERPPIFAKKGNFILLSAWNAREDPNDPSHSDYDYEGCEGCAKLKLYPDDECCCRGSMCIFFISVWLVAVNGSFIIINEPKGADAFFQGLLQLILVEIGHMTLYAQFDVPVAKSLFGLLYQGAVHILSFGFFFVNPGF